MMKRTMIYLADEQDRGLRLRAARESRPIAELIREAVDSYLKKDLDDSLLMGFVGSGAGPQGGDASEHIDEALEEELS